MRGYIRRDSYDIPYRMEKGSGDKVVIVAHGFASSKESPTVEMLAKELPEKGIGVAALDFPAHRGKPGGRRIPHGEKLCQRFGRCGSVYKGGMPRGGDMPASAPASALTLR